MAAKGQIMKRISGFSFFALMVLISSLTSAVSAQTASSSIAQPDLSSVQQTVTVAQVSRHTCLDGVYSRCLTSAPMGPNSYIC